MIGVKNRLVDPALVVRLLFRSQSLLVSQKQGGKSVNSNLADLAASIFFFLWSIYLLTILHFRGTEQ